MNIVSYIRVSGKGQLDGDGPDRQRDSVHAFASVHGLVNAREFFERGVSGTKTDRVTFSEMLEFVEAHKIDGIVVERLDRIARDLMVSEFLLKECRERNLKVFATDVGLIDQATNDGDPTRKLIRQVLGAVAEFAKSELVLKLSKARKRIKEKTGKCEGRKPYGHRRNEQEILDFVKGLVVTGADLRGVTVANLLNQAGFKTQYGNPFCRQAAERLVKIAKGIK
jgi:DNA invertase Pin-like site-specific DNA recombinase